MSASCGSNDRLEGRSKSDSTPPKALATKGAIKAAHVREAATGAVRPCKSCGSGSACPATKNATSDTARLAPISRPARCACKYNGISTAPGRRKKPWRRTPIDAPGEGHADRAWVYAHFLEQQVGDGIDAAIARFRGVVIDTITARDGTR